MEFCGCSSSSSSSSTSHISSQSNRCFAMSARLLIREPQNGHEKQLKAGRGLGPLGESRINVQPVSGGMSVLAVWCQKQLIGFSLHSVQSTVTSSQHQLQTKDREWRKKRAREDEFHVSAHLNHILSTGASSCSSQLTAGRRVLS